MATTFLDGRVTLHGGDCLEILRTLPDASVDSVVTDPPYHLTSIVKRFGAAGAAPPKTKQTGAFARAARGFMGQTWDGGDIAFREELWAEVLRVLKPGGHLAAFSATRTYHRMAVAIEDAGFEIRDQLAWTYGSGFPKGGLDDEGRGVALKPAWEPICLGRKPLIGTVAVNLLTHGVGALNIDSCRVGERGARNNGRQAGTNGIYGEIGATSAVDYGKGRFPSNLIHDGSSEVLSAFPGAPGQQFAVGPEHGARPSKGIYGDFGARPPSPPRGGSGSAARFFYAAKADADDRIGSDHPTVKPVDLMQWLVRLVTPKGGVVLDPFAGTGTTGEAAWREGCRAVLIEREAVYQTDIARRMALATAGPDERRLKMAAMKPAADAGPLVASPEAVE